MAKRKRQKKQNNSDNLIAVIVADNNFGKEENNIFFDALFSQEIPLQIFVQRSMLENGNFPLKYLDRENVFPLHGDDFIKAAKRKAEGKRKIVFKKPCIISENAFEKVSSHKGILFELAAKMIFSPSK